MFSAYLRPHAGTELCVSAGGGGGGRHQSLISLLRVFSLLFPQTAKIDSSGE